MDWVDGQLIISVFVTLFVIMDPPGTVPLFLSLTAGMTAQQRNRSALQALAVAAGVTTAFAAFGQKILTYMHISLAALQGAGGILLILIALQLLTGANDGQESASRYKNVAFVPLGTPLMAGPGAVVAVMLFLREADSPARVTALVAGAVVTFAALYLAMRFASLVQKILSEDGVELVTRKCLSKSSTGMGSD
jgi:multiple antibiotic resistance protein